MGPIPRGPVLSPAGISITSLCSWSVVRAAHHRPDRRPRPLTALRPCPNPRPNPRPSPLPNHVHERSHGTKCAPNGSRRAGAPGPTGLPFSPATPRGSSPGSGMVTAQYPSPRPLRGPCPRGPVPLYLGMTLTSSTGAVPKTSPHHFSQPRPDQPRSPILVLQRDFFRVRPDASRCVCDGTDRRRGSAFG